MPEKKTCEIFLVINEDGDYSVGEDIDVAVERHNEDWGGNMRRVVKLVVKVAAPIVTETEVDVADDAGETAKVEVEAA